MTFEADFYSTLSGHAGLTAIVSNRIVPAHEDQPAAPYVVYTVIFTDTFYTLAGSSSTTRARVQVDCYANDYDTTVASAAAVIAAIPQSGTPICRAAHYEQDLGIEPSTRLYRRLLEFSIFHRSS